MIGELAYAIPIAIICVLGSAFCSGTEVALFSLRRVDREQLARSERLVDKRIVALLERPRRLIATVLIGNDAFNSLLAVVALSVVLRQWAGAITGSALWAIAGIALAVTLPAVVLLAEVTSKTLAAKAPLAWSRFCVLPLSGFMLLVTPVRWVVQLVTTVLLAPLGEAARTRPARDLSEEEFRTLVDAAQGQVDARERRLIHRVFDFSDKNVGQVMTPREKMYALSYDLPVQRLLKELSTRGFSRVPIFQKSLDNIRGVLNAKDLVKVTAGQPLGRPLGELLHEPLFVPRTTPVKRLFLTFKQKKVHMAIVVSEYGKVLGIVTMDDLLAQIFGQLRDERAELQSAAQGRSKAKTPAPGVEITTAAMEPEPERVGSERLASEPVDHGPDAVDTSVPVDRIEEGDLDPREEIERDGSNGERRREPSVERGNPHGEGKAP
ncbi:MAG TPA: hemolysin family protein [Kofleriaceae bacterium]|nr:hemolysin family protein [Kofleriaceae bacterium]